MVFLQFFQDHLLLAHADLKSCLIILETHFGKVWRESIAMVTRYNLIINMESSISYEKKKKKTYKNATKSGKMFLKLYPYISYINFFPFR